MAANPDFKKFVVKDVEFLWPRLDQTYRYNNAEKKTEPVDPKVQGAGYSLAWKMPKAKASELKKELLAHYADCKSRNSKLPDNPVVFGAKVLKDEDGKATDDVQFTAKKKAVSNAGAELDPPKVVGPDLQPLADKRIWSGSIGHIRTLAFATIDPDGKGGISLLLDAVQVNQAEYGGDNLEDDFGPARDIGHESFGDETKAAAEREPEPADDF